MPFQSPIRSSLPIRENRAYDAVFVVACLLVGSVGAFSACHVDAPRRDEASPTVLAAPAVADSPAKATTGNPLVGMRPAIGAAPFSAVVAERVRAGGYAYLRLTTATGDERWLATMGTGQTPGSHVTVKAYGSREDFHSRRTGMTFDHLLFGEVELAVEPQT